MVLQTRYSQRSSGDGETSVDFASAIGDYYQHREEIGRNSTLLRIHEARSVEENSIIRNMASKVPG